MSIPALSSHAYRRSPAPYRPARRVYEIEHDGFRFICHRDGERVRVFSQNPLGPGRSTDWIKVKNPDAPEATRVIEG